VLCGGAVLAGLPVVGLGFLAPSRSWVQVALWALGGVPSALAVLAMPVWFLLLARALRSRSEALVGSARG
jgi:hypothetical protein